MSDISTPSKTESGKQEDLHLPGTYWFARQYKTDFETLKKDPSSGGLNYEIRIDEQGNPYKFVTNELVWEDPKIAQKDNFNLLTDDGKQLLWNTLFGLAGSGTLDWMAYGASSTAAAHNDSHLAYEHILDGTRIILTNQSGTIMTSGSVVNLSTFVDSTYTPNITYYTSATVMGTITGATTLNINQPVQEFGIASAAACPSSPSGSSGKLFNHYILGAPTTLTNTTTLQILVIFRA